MSTPKNTKRKAMHASTQRMVGKVSMMGVVGAVGMVGMMHVMVLMSLPQ